MKTELLFKISVKQAVTLGHPHIVYLFSDRDKYSKQPLNILRRIEKES